MKKDLEGLRFLKEFLIKYPEKKSGLATHAGVMTTGAVDKWLERKALPRVKRNKILSYIRRTS